MSYSQSRFLLAEKKNPRSQPHKARGALSLILTFYSVLYLPDDVQFVRFGRVPVDIAPTLPGRKMALATALGKSFSSPPVKFIC